MKVLGHSSVSMALVYAQVSDREVLRDHKYVLEHGAVARRLTGLLTDLGETTDPDDSNPSGRSSCTSTD
ncbi:hypothetical protein AB0J35_51375 [Nonomuraea angiospora]|uniref:hypothetical protein n=1 Tax=Nonomuraea angiospora TaxID=46172 RepID=UPI00343FBC0E